MSCCCVTISPSVPTQTKKMVFHTVCVRVRGVWPHISVWDHLQMSTCVHGDQQPHVSSLRCCPPLYEAKFLMRMEFSQQAKLAGRESQGATISAFTHLGLQVCTPCPACINVSSGTQTQVPMLARQALWCLRQLPRPPYSISQNLRTLSASAGWLQLMVLCELVFRLSRRVIVRIYSLVLGNLCPRSLSC